MMCCASRRRSPEEAQRILGLFRIAPDSDAPRLHPGYLLQHK